MIGRPTWGSGYRDIVSVVGGKLPNSMRVISEHYIHLIPTEKRKNNQTISECLHMNRTN